MLDPPDGVRTEPEICVELLTRLGAIPADDLRDLAAADLDAFQRRLFGLFAEEPAYVTVGAAILSETLGRARLGVRMRAAAAMWAASHRCASMYERQVERALDSELTGGELGLEVFERVATST